MTNKKKRSTEAAVREIRRRTRRKFAPEEKVRIVLEGLRGEQSISELCRREGIAANLYYRWSKDFLEAGKKQLAGDTVREATSNEVKELRDKREGVARQLASARIELPAVEDLKPRLREKLRDLESSLKADVALGRLALGGLLGDRRLKVYRDGRIEGSAVPVPRNTAGPRANPGACRP
jgi:transposase